MSAARARPEGRPQRTPRREPRLPIHPRRLWLFRLVVMAVTPGFTLLLLEAGLRLVGYGFPSAAVVPHEIDGAASYCNNYRFSWRFFPPTMARTAESFAFSAAKADNSYRIFILGSSAAAGTPDGSYAFGRILQAMLRRQYPQTDFQVITMAMPAINSHAIRLMARDCARHQPDLFVVYMGNNEVVGPYGAGTVFAPLRSSLSLIRLAIAAKATRVGQLIVAASQAGDAPRTWQGMQMFRGHQVAAGDARLQVVYDHFRENVEDICRLAGKGGIPVILCTVPCNLKDSPPFASQHRPDLTDPQKDRWEAIYQQGVAAETSGDWDAALEQYSAAAQIDDRYADLHFRMGRCYWHSGRFEKARDSFVLARELDTLRFRADTRINEILREAARQPAGRMPNRVSLLDAVKLFEENSPHGAPGEELFYEHVHMNFSGNYLLARGVFEQMRTILPESAAAEPPPGEAQCAEDLAYTAWDRHRLAGEVLNVYIKHPPFTNQIDHSQQVMSMERRNRALKAGLTPQVMGEVDRQYRQAVERLPRDWWLHWNYGQFLEQTGSARAAAQQFQHVCRLVPQRFEAVAKLGQLAGQQGDLAGAIARNEEALRSNPLFADAWFNLGLAHHLQNKLDRSAEYYAEAIRCKADHAQAYINLGVVLYQQGKAEQAAETYRKGLAAVPDNVELRCNLALLLVERGQRQQALKELAAAEKLDPNAPAVRKARDAIR